MATFPKLKTNAVAQYPATKGVRFQNQVLRFVDGNEQRYRDAAGPLHRWQIRLAELDESEAAAIDAFFAVNQGTYANFSFTDPWDAKVYTNCSLESDALDATVLGEMRGKVALIVVENRG